MYQSDAKFRNSENNFGFFHVLWLFLSKKQVWSVCPVMPHVAAAAVEHFFATPTAYIIKSRELIFRLPAIWVNFLLKSLE
jgi:hypothetical protein